MCCIEYTLPWAGFDLTTLVVIGTDWTGSYKSNNDKITTTTAPIYIPSKSNHSNTSDTIGTIRPRHPLSIYRPSQIIATPVPPLVPYDHDDDHDTPYIYTVQVKSWQHQWHHRYHTMTTTTTPPIYIPSKSNHSNTSDTIGTIRWRRPRHPLSIYRPSQIIATPVTP